MDKSITQEIEILYKNERRLLVSCFDKMGEVITVDHSLEDFLSAYDRATSRELGETSICPQCKQKTLVSRDVQLRSTDEGANTVQKCTVCNYKKIL